MRFPLRTKHRPSPWKGALAGLAGGLVASWVMNRFQSAVPASAFERLLGEPAGSYESSGEPVTVKTAEAVAGGVFDHELSEDEKAWAGPAVHYTFGTAVGGLYGAVAESAPAVTAGAGLPFGAAFWLVADEAAVPALGLSAPPSAVPPSTHLYAFASHLVFGLAAEVTRGLVRRLL